MYGKTKPKGSYSRTKKPSFNPNGWTNGFQKALQQVADFERKGWTVDTERGALTGGQADSFKKQVETQGFEAQAIPISELDNGEVASFIAYRPKTSAGSKGQPSGVTDPSESRFVDIIQQTFGDAKNVDGIYTGAKGVVGFAAANATSSNSLLTEAKQAFTSPLGTLNPAAIQNAINSKKLYVTFGFDSGYDLQYVEWVTRVLGNNVTVGKVEDGKALFVKNPQGDMMFVAPIVDVVHDNATETIAYSDAVNAVTP